MGTIENRPCPLVVPVTEVLRICRARADKEVIPDEDVFAVAEICAPCVVGAELKPVRQFLLETHVAGMVLGLTCRFEKGAATPVGVHSSRVCGGGSRR